MVAVHMLSGLDKNKIWQHPYLSRYEIGGSLWRAGEGQLLARDHHHLGARACLVDMGRRHRTRATAGRDTPRPAAGRQAGPVGVIGLERRHGGKYRWKIREKGGGRERTVGRW